MGLLDFFQNPYSQSAQEKWDTWICQNGTAAQKASVGKHNGSRVRCDGTPVDLDSQIQSAEQEVNQRAIAMQKAQDALRRYPRQTEVQGPPLNVPSRADQKKNTFSKLFDPKQRKIIVLLIAGFLLFLAATNAE